MRYTRMGNLLIILKRNTHVCVRWGLVLALLLSAFTVAGEAKTATRSDLQVPQNAIQHIPLVKETIKNCWSTVPLPAALPAQVEQETCASATSKKCWNPRAELKTSREYGVGWGQLTIAYNSDGSTRFNNFEEAKKLDAKLKSWKWEDRYDPARQLRALVLMDRVAFTKLSFAVDYERMAFMFSAYNGGLGGVMQDRRLALSKGVDPNKWFGNVELYSFKSKTKAQGYGQSFFEVNRGYVRNVLKVRMQKYQPFFN